MAVRLQSMPELRSITKQNAEQNSHAAQRRTLRVSMSVIQTILAPSMQPSSLSACRQLQQVNGSSKTDYRCHANVMKMCHYGSM
jgi:hypothetical protein